MKTDTLLLLGGGGVLLYLMTRNSGSGVPAPVVGSYGSSFAKPNNGARTAGGAAAAPAPASNTNPLGSLLSALGSVAKGLGGGGGSSSGGSRGSSSTPNIGPTFGGDTPGETVFGDGGGTVFSTDSGSSVSFANSDFTDLFGDPYGNGQPYYDTAGVDVGSFDTSGNDSSGNDSYTGGGDYGGYSGDFGDLGSDW